MDNIEQHIEKDREILQDPTISPQQRRHIEGELEELELYHEKHPDDDHDPNAFELYCDANPDAPECKTYDV